MRNRPAPETIPTPEGVSLCPCPWCGAEAHTVAFTTHLINRDADKTLYGVECGSKKHKSPLAFSTAKSAATFWNESVERAGDKLIFAVARK